MIVLGTYAVVRTDGSVPAWPYVVLSAADECAVVALLAYTRQARALGYPPHEVARAVLLAGRFADWRHEAGITGDVRDNPDDHNPAVLALINRKADLARYHGRDPSPETETLGSRAMRDPKSLTLEDIQSLGAAVVAVSHNDAETRVDEPPE